MPRSRVPLMVAVMLPMLLGSGSMVMRVEDFGGYWCGARLLAAGSNPYDLDAILKLERDIEPERREPQMPWGPPWAFVLLLPFTWLDFAAARWLGLAVMAGGLGWASYHLWRLYAAQMQRPDATGNVPFCWLTCFSFYPILLLIALGQVSVACPLAMAGFLILLQRRRDIVAGLVLSLIAAKPQVVLLFALAALIWIVWQRRWLIFLGGAAGLGLQTALVLWLNPRIFVEYVTALSKFGPKDAPQPTPAALLQFLAGGGTWPTLVPLAVGVVWLIWHMARRPEWSWPRELPNLCFACVLTSPHAWVYDFGVLLVPLQCMAVSACAASVARRWTFLAIHLLATLTAIAMNLKHFPEFYYAWLLPLYLVLYIVFATWDKQYATASRAP